MKKTLFLFYAIVVSTISNAAQMWPIILDEVTATSLQDYIVGDFRVDDVSNHLYIWASGETYNFGDGVGLNFFGNTEGYLSLTVAAPEGWSGMGFSIENAASVSAMQSLKNAIVANPNNYYLHIAMKATTPGNHQFYTFGTSETSFAIGTSTIENGQVIGDFPRDGTWHEFYIPMAQYANAIANSDVRSGTNILCVLSGAQVGAQLNLDAVYFCDQDIVNEFSVGKRCGANLSWTVTRDSVLSITGYGDMYDFEIGKTPWNNLTNEILSINISDSVTSIGQYAFSQCGSLTSVAIPNSVTSIGDFAFENCSSLTSVTIPNSVTSIGDCAFVHCHSLTSVNIPNSVTNIGMHIFDGAENLTSIIAPAKVFEGIYSSTHVENVCVNSGELTESAFIHIALSYKTLKSIDISAATNTKLADEAFYGCYNLQSLVLPANLSQISYMAVAGCKNLQSINVPASVTEIGQSAFENCRSLTNVGFAANSAITSIGNWAFYNCHALQSIAIPEGVEEIGDGAFYGCTYLQEMHLPASLRQMGDNSFALCSRLQKITSNAVVPPTIADKTFFEVSTEIPVYVPLSSAAAYRADQFWGRLNIIGAETAVENTTIDANAVRKQLIDGQLFILHDGSRYTATGIRVQ